MIHTIESNSKRRINVQFDAVSSAVCQFSKTSPSIPVIDVSPIEGDAYKMIRFTFGASFITIRTVAKIIEISIHHRSNHEVPNDYFSDQSLVAELKAYLSKSLPEAKWRIKQDRSRA